MNPNYFNEISILPYHYCSMHYLSKDLSNQQYLSVLYLAFFNREPDSSGFVAWLQSLENGIERITILDQFLRSSEFKSVCNKYAIKCYSDSPISIKGEKGDKGDTGLTGEKGNTGLIGARGNIGLTGARGNTGLTGPAGSIPSGDMNINGSLDVNGSLDINDGELSIRNSSGNRFLNIYSNGSDTIINNPTSGGSFRISDDIILRFSNNATWKTLHAGKIKLNGLSNGIDFYNSLSVKIGAIINQGNRITIKSYNGAYIELKGDVKITGNLTVDGSIIN